MYLDPATREAFKDAHKFFPNTDNVSGSFHGCVPALHQKKIHINPNPSVKLSQDKAKLFDMLSKSGVPVGNFTPVSTLIPKKGEFRILDLEDIFGAEETWSDKPIQARHNSGATIFTGVSDFMSWLRGLSEKPSSFEHDVRNHGVFLQPNIVGGKNEAITVIPNARGHKLRFGGEMITDGVVSRNRISPQIKEMACDVADALDMDFATISVLYDPETDEVEILDIDTRLKPAYNEPLLSYAEMLQKHAKK